MWDAQKGDTFDALQECVILPVVGDYECLADRSATCCLPVAIVPYLLGDDTSKTMTDEKQRPILLALRTSLQLRPSQEIHRKFRSASNRRSPNEIRIVSVGEYSRVWEWVGR